MIQPRSSLSIFGAILLLGGSGWVARVQAQELPRSFPSFSYAPIGDTTGPGIAAIELGDTSSIPKTYWLEGALVLGTLSGVFFGALAGGLCSDSDSGGGTGPCWDNTLLGGVVGFAIGASLGGLIGGQLKKPSKEDKADTQLEPAGQDSTEYNQ